MIKNKNELSSLKGFFFYYQIIRKDLFNKFFFIKITKIPKINKIYSFVQTYQKDRQISDIQIFNCMMLFEFLTNCFCNVTLCNIIKLDHFTTFHNYKLEVNFLSFIYIYEFFVFIYFLWFRGLIYVIEEFSILKGMFIKDRFKRRVDFISIEYFRHIKPHFYKISKKIKNNNKKSVNIKSTFWYDFTFCNFIPINITDSCSLFKFNLQFFFNTKLYELKIKMLLSGLKLFHRFQELKIYG